MVRYRKLNPPASVYVIDLASGAAHREKDKDRARKGAPVVYVGQSALSPEVRLKHHRQGGAHTSSAVRKWGRQVLWSTGPFSDRDQAERVERQVAEELRRAGAVVLGGH